MVLGFDYVCTSVLHLEADALAHVLNPLNAELNPICHLLALLGAHHIFHVSGLRVKSTFVQNFVIFLL